MNNKNHSGQRNGQQFQGGRGQQGNQRTQGQGWQGNQDRNQNSGQFRGVGPRGYVRSDDRIREDVSHLLADHGQIDASEIEVQVKSGEVTLTGTVPDHRMKGLILRTLHGTPGVQQLFDQVRVNREEPKEQTGAPTRSGIGKEQRPSAS